MQGNTDTNDIINTNVQSDPKEDTKSKERKNSELKKQTTQNISEINLNNNFNNEETNVENLLKLIKDQSSELKKNKKRLEKLEEAFKKTSSDLKLISADKANLENFLKIIFPKEMHDNIIKIENGSYNSSDISKFWLVCESKNQNEFQKILNQLKNENSDYSDKNKNLQIDLDNKNKELKKLRTSFEDLTNKYNDDKNKFTEIFSKYDIIESEKNFLMNLVDEKNKEIEHLRELEIENAELKAKSLLEGINLGNSIKNNSNNNYNINKNNDSIINNSNNQNGDYGNVKSRFDDYGNKNSNMLKILTLNAGTQTSEEIFYVEFVKNIENQLQEKKENFDKLRKEFSEHKERSHKILLVNEENSNKISKENEELKQRILEIANDYHKIGNTKTSPIPNKNQENNLNPNSEINNNYDNIKLKDHYDDLNPDFKISQINSHRISIEYLKNVLLKYLEAIAIGNEFQIKILENVIFSILRIPNSERIKLEEKRNRSSFYLNLWYNAKAYLAQKIYGNASDLGDSIDNANNPEGFNFEMDKNFLNSIQGNNNIIPNKDEQNKENINNTNVNSEIKSKIDNKNFDEEEIDIDI